MGNLLGCVDKISEEKRQQYDMSAIKNNHVPIIWLVGPPGSGRTTQADILSQNLGYEVIYVAGLIKDEATKETERGEVVRETLKDDNKRLPDTIVVDLIKEEMLKKANEAKAFVLNGFPRTSKQATLFTKEVRDVDVIFYLYSETHKLVSRIQQKIGNINEENVKKVIFDYVNDVRNGISKFSSKVEKIYTDAPPRDVFNKIESALNLRLKHSSTDSSTSVF